MSRSRTLVDARARRRHALHHDVEDLLLAEDASDLDALQQRGLGAAHVAGLDAAAAGGVELGLDLDRRLRRRQLDLRVDDAVDAGRRAPRTFSAVARRRLEVLAEDADDERLARAGQFVQRAVLAGLPAADERADVADLLLRVRNDACS